MEQQISVVTIVIGIHNILNLVVILMMTTLMHMKCAVVAKVIYGLYDNICINNYTYKKFTYYKKLVFVQIFNMS